MPATHATWIGVGGRLCLFYGACRGTRFYELRKGFMSGEPRFMSVRLTV